MARNEWEKVHARLTFLEIDTGSSILLFFPIRIHFDHLASLGLGFANIGGLLMAQGHSYDSDEGRAICATITAIMTGTAYATSAEIASESIRSCRAAPDIPSVLMESTQLFAGANISL